MCDSYPLSLVAALPSVHPAQRLYSCQRLLGLMVSWTTRRTEMMMTMESDVIEIVTRRAMRPVCGALQERHRVAHPSRGRAYRYSVAPHRHVRVGCLVAEVRWDDR